MSNYIEKSSPWRDSNPQSCPEPTSKVGAFAFRHRGLNQADHGCRRDPLGSEGGGLYGGSTTIVTVMDSVR